ncbi:MAG: hypothetical protein KGO96_07270 [Elusimicrobia bacterium]|nr:hypothetical protein [Elusimicrobiota bacterium]
MFRFTQGDTLNLTFRLIDDSRDRFDQGFNPPGRVYFPQSGLSNRNIVAGLSGNALSLTVAASPTNVITISFIPPSTATWNAVPQAGDLLNIPSGSVLAGAGNANVGNYTVLSSTNTTVTAVKTPFTTLPVNVATATLTATVANDLVDSSYSAILQVQISNTNLANIISRWAFQPNPGVDPSIWQLPIYATDPIAGGTSDLYLMLIEGTTVTSGTTRGVLSVSPTTNNFASVAINAGTGAVTNFTF